jgi:DUF4097 and DUF4098 domain-containing protein YvlB
MKLRIISVGFVLLLAAASVGARAVSVNENERTQKIERSIPADPAVTVSICLASGNINVRGWDKDEVKARSDAAEIELRRKDTPTAQAGRVTKLDVLVIDQANQQRGRDGCQAFSDLELNVPRTASVRVHTRDGNISIADVSMAFAGTQNGDVSIAKISHAVEVATVGGSISVRDSIGRTSITSIGGGIEAVNISPSASGDPFEAISVTGDLMLDRISHAQLNAKTVTGNVSMTGPLAQRGRYEFRTMSGDVTLVLPVDASFNLSAKIAQNGEIVTDFPLRLLTEDLVGPRPAPPAAPSAKSTPSKPSATAGPSAKATASKPGATAPPTPAPKTSPMPPIVIKVDPRFKEDAPVAVPVYKLRRYSAVCGEGGATIYVASFGGTLHLQKKN